MFLSLKVYFIFLNVSQELERTEAFLLVLEIFFGEFLDAVYFFGFYFDENNLVKENPLFYLLSPFYFEENGLREPSSKNG